MAHTLIDSDILIDAIRGREALRALLRRMIEDETAAISSVSAFEVLVGIRNESERTGALDLLDALVCFDLDRASADHAAAVDQVLRSAGLRIDARDCLIAGTAIAYRLPLLTRNLRHFERIPGLEVITV